MSNPSPGRAETYEQKRAVMEKILSYWAQHPKLRLGQLIQNAADVRGANIFYLEDDKLVELLKAYDQAFPSADEAQKAQET